MIKWHGQFSESNGDRIEVHLASPSFCSKSKIGTAAQISLTLSWDEEEGAYARKDISGSLTPPELDCTMVSNPGGHVGDLPPLALQIIPSSKHASSLTLIKLFGVNVISEVYTDLSNESEPYAADLVIQKHKITFVAKSITALPSRTECRKEHPFP